MMEEFECLVDVATSWLNLAFTCALGFKACTLKKSRLESQGATRTVLSVESYHLDDLPGTLLIFAALMSTSARPTQPAEQKHDMLIHGICIEKVVLRVSIQLIFRILYAGVPISVSQNLEFASYCHWRASQLLYHFWKRIVSASNSGGIKVDWIPHYDGW